jgi:hypothetical protein
LITQRAKRKKMAKFLILPFYGKNYSWKSMAWALVGTSMYKEYFTIKKLQNIRHGVVVTGYGLLKTAPKCIFNI